MAELDDKVLEDALSFGAEDEKGDMETTGAMSATLQLKVQGRR